MSSIEKSVRGTTHNWQERLNRELKKVNEDTTFEEFIDILWNHAILERIDPSDTETREYRKGKGKYIAEFRRTDERLYIRLYYLLVEFKRKAKDNTTIYSDILGGIISNIGKILTLTLEITKASNPIDKVMDELIEKAQTEYIKLSKKAPLINLEIEQKGTIRGIRVKIERFLENGHLEVDPINLGQRDFSDLSKEIDFYNVDPREFLPDE